jgi:hypothetical protein
MSEPEKFQLTFENGGYWNYYKDLENQFEDFLQYVPYSEGNEKTYSFRLLNLFLSIGGHIDSAFKEMARYSDFADNPSCRDIIERASNREGIFLTAIRTFDEIYGLSSKKVIFKPLPERTALMPFNSNEQEWWTCYNAVKHNFSSNFKKANLENVRDALAAAFLINVVHIPAYIMLMEYRLVTPQASGTSFGYFTLKGNWKDSVKRLISKGKRFGLITTPLFSYDYQETEGIK